MLSKIFLLIFIFVVQYVNIVNAQPSYSATRYDNQSGLPSNGIKGMAYDSSTGMLWIGSESGLSRFDGHRFYKVTLDSGYRSGNRIAVLDNSLDDSIYFFTNNRRLFVLRNGLPVLIPYEAQQLVPKNFESFSIIEKARLLVLLKYPWVVSYWMSHAIDTTGGNKRCLLVDRDTAWLYNRSKNTCVPIRKVLTGSMPFVVDGVFFILEAQKIYKANEQTNQFELHTIQGLEPTDTVLMRPLYIMVLQKHKRFLVTQDKLWALRLEHGQLTVRLLYDQLPPQSETVAVVEIPGMSVMAFGSATDGLTLIQKRTVINKRAHKLSSTATHVLYEQVELGPDTVLSYRDVLMTAGSGEPPNRTGIARTFNYFKDAGGSIWYYHADSIYRYNPITGNSRFLLREQNSKVVFVETKRGMMAISNSGIYILENNHFKKFIANTGDPWDVNAAINFEDSTFLFATQNGCVTCNIYKGTIQLTPVNPATRVRCLWKYNEYIFMGTYGQGILIMKNGIVKRIPLDRKLNLLFTHCFVPDDNGYCFMSTNNGILKASIKAMTAAYDKGLPYIYYHYIGKKDGMETTELNGSCQPCALRLHSGYMSFPSLDGLKWLHPNAATIPPEGKVTFYEIRAADTIYPITTSLQFASGTQALQFRFSIPYWGNTENLYCFYRLQGHDTSWHIFDPVEINSLSYNNLGHGSYVLEIKVLTGFEPGEEKIASFPFSILKPWYLEWWAFVFCAIAILGLISWFVHLRTAYLLRKSLLLQQQIDSQTQSLAEQKKQLEVQVATLKAYQANLEKSGRFKSRLISIIGHDILTPLRFMKQMGDSIMRQKEPMSSGMQERIGQSIAASAHDMEEMSVNMLNWIKVQQEGTPIAATTFSPYKTTENIIGIFNNTLKEKGIIAINNIDTNLYINQYEEPVRIILHNLIMNATRYSNGGLITIGLVVTEQKTYCISVGDQGQGMDPEKIQQLLHQSDTTTYEGQGHGLGFQIIHDMLHIIGGRIDIKSIPQQGTTVHVYFSSYL